MARDSDGLAVRKWAKSETALALAPTDITPADGLPASYGVDSFISLEVFNYLWRQVTALGEDVAKHGVLEWDAAQEYLHPSFVVGSDTNLYQSVQASGGSNTSQDPTTDDGTYWTLASSLDIANASETVPGIIRTATVSEALAGTSVSTAVTPEALAAVTNQLLADAASGVTPEPGEYVFSESGARTWPWNTTKGRAVLSYVDDGGGRRGEPLVLQNALLTGGSDSDRGFASDGSTFWIIARNRHGNYNVLAWTISGVRDSDKDISIPNDYHGLTFLNGSLLSVEDGGGVFTINPASGSRQIVISITDTDERRGITSDGVTLWVVNNTQKIVEAYSATDWSRQTGKDITLGYGTGDRWYDAATDGTTIWIRQYDLSAALAWDITSRARDPKKDFFLGVISGSSGLTVNNSVLYMVYHIGGIVTPYFTLENIKLTSDRGLVVGSTSYGGVDPRGVIDDSALGSSYGNRDFAGGIASNGTTVWGIGAGASNSFAIAEAWKVSDGTRDTTKDITTTSRGYRVGAFIVGNKLFTLNYTTGALESYNTDTGSFVSTVLTISDLSGYNGHGGMTSDGTTIWVVRRNLKQLQAYLLSDGSRVPSKDISLINTLYEDAATNGTTIWVSYRTNAVLQAWDIATLSRTPHLDIELNPAYFGAFNVAPIIRRIDIDGSVLYVRGVDNLLYYQLATNQQFGPGHYELTGISQGDTIRATLKDEEDFAIVYPVY